MPSHSSLVLVLGPFRPVAVTMIDYVALAFFLIMHVPSDWFGLLVLFWDLFTALCL